VNRAAPPENKRGANDEDACPIKLRNRAPRRQSSVAVSPQAAKRDQPLRVSGPPRVNGKQLREVVGNKAEDVNKQLVESLNSRPAAQINKSKPIR
jgi:hypothetical protein